MSGGLAARIHAVHSDLLADVGARGMCINMLDLS